MVRNSNLFFGSLFRIFSLKAFMDTELKYKLLGEVSGVFAEL